MIIVVRCYRCQDATSKVLCVVTLDRKQQCLRPSRRGWVASSNAIMLYSGHALHIDGFNSGTLKQRGMLRERYVDRDCEQQILTSKLVYRHGGTAKELPCLSIELPCFSVVYDGQDHTRPLDEAKGWKTRQEDTTTQGQSALVQQQAVVMLQLLQAPRV